MTEELPWQPEVDSSVLHSLLAHAVRAADRSEYTVALESSVAFTEALKSAHENGYLDDDAVRFILHHHRGRYT